MDFNFLEIFETLVLEHKVEVKEGVVLTCGDEINPKIYRKDGKVVIEFGAPFPYLHITKMGLDISNLVKPKVNKIELTKTNINIWLSILPYAIEFKRP